MNGHSQEFIYQDTNTHQFRFVIDFFKHKKNGFFIEMGAADGILASNTYQLEKNYGWDGILIEPIKDYFNQIAQYRKIKKIFNVCIGEHEGTVNFTRVEGHSKLLSGISSQYHSEHKKRIEREAKEKNQQIYFDSVDCKKLITILNQYNITCVDYLSIDVEGGELSVLKSIEMETNKIRPLLIGCENNYKTSDIENYLKQFSYTKIGHIGGDDFFYYNQTEKIKI